MEFWDRYVSPREFRTVEGWELQNMLLVARLMIDSALAREESRGVHFRDDFPRPGRGRGSMCRCRGQGNSRAAPSGDRWCSRDSLKAVLLRFLPSSAAVRRACGTRAGRMRGFDL